VKHGEFVGWQTQGQNLMVGHILRYHPAILKLQQLIRDGALGKINYLYSICSTSAKSGRRRTSSELCSHDISVVLSLLNEMPTACPARAEPG
jgi:UDP-2-acetamido-3-amino-2,3-dideoxy-glucuronate N-acetyltransferase